ncbi:MAG: complex I NDUFA9 subunit family protein [Beijerinckiaceae bacterium]|nr:complex I NDUFA9 subunit family protein [Beijerinckiaceae bacterium]
MAQGSRLVTIFGGSGFVGRHLVRALAREGWRIRVAVRRPDLAGHLQPLGAVGQIHAVQANLRYRDSVARALQGADAAVNLVGILAEGGRQSFNAVQAQGARAVAEEAAKAGITRFVQLSAIGADAHSAAAYARTKAEGEAFVQAAIPEAVILRPSIVFGPEDQFFNRFARMAQFLPFLPLIGGGETRFQPVFVGDVALAAAKALDGGARAGTTYELGGPDIRSFRELLDYILAVTHRRRLLVPVPFPLARLKASVLEVLPGKMLTVDQVTMLETDNVVSAAAEAEGRTLAGLGISPASFEAIVPTYLYAFRPHGQFDRPESAA